MRKSITFCLAVMLLLLSACGGSTAADVNLNDVLADITSTVQLPEAMTEMTMDQMTAIYGIESSDILQFAGSYNDIGTLADEIIMIEATDSDAAAAVKEKVDARYQAKLNEMKDYLPDEYEKILGCEVLVNGNYIAMFISADAESMQEIYEAALKG